MKIEAAKPKIQTQVILSYVVEWMHNAIISYELLYAHTSPSLEANNNGRDRMQVENVSLIHIFLLVP